MMFLGSDWYQRCIKTFLHITLVNLHLPRDLFTLFELDVNVLIADRGITIKRHLKCVYIIF